MFKILGIGLLAFSLQATAESKLLIRMKGERVGEFSLDQLKQLEKPQQIEVFEPHEKKKRIYTGFAFKPLIEATLGKVEAYRDEWQKYDDVMFTCIDGYQATLDLKKVLKYDTYLAFGDANSDSFIITNTLQNNEKISAGPFYLVWNNIKFPDLKSSGANGWPYQVTGIDFINFKDRFPKTAPIANASEEVREGFRLFREKCLMCHKVNGEGGEKGPELNHPVSVTVTMKEEWLYKWIKNPIAIRSGTTMPGYTPNANPDKEIKAIMTYLKHKAAPVK